MTSPFRFRILSKIYRYPRGRYAVKISDVAGILNIAAGFERQPYKNGRS